MNLLNYIRGKAASLSTSQPAENRTTNRKPSYAPQTVRKPILQARQDISDWKHAKYTATAISDPKQYLLQDIYTNIGGDALLSSQINNRKEQTISAPFELITPDEKPDERMTAILRELPVIQDIFSHILDSEFYGNSLIELSSENGIKRVDLINRRNVVPDFGRYYKDTSFNSYIEYREAGEFGKWLLEFNSDHLGLLDKAVPHILFKKFAQTCWSMLCEIYGIPPRVLKTNTGDPAMLAQAENMMRDIGTAAWFIIDTTEEFNFANSVNTNGDVYNNLITLCNNEISMLISGAIIGQDTKNGNESKEKISMSILDRLVFSDKRMIEMYMNSIVIPALYRIHWIPATASRFRFSLAEDIDKLFDMTVKIMPHKKVSDKFIMDKFGIEVTGDRFEQPTETGKSERKFLKGAQTSTPFKLSLADYYNCACPNCGGAVDKIVLSDTENDRLQSAFNKVARWAYDEKKTEITADDLTNKQVTPLISEINSVLQGGIEKAITYEIPDVMRRHLKESVYVFSGCKTFAELCEVGDLLVDGEGKVKPFYKFFNDVREVHEKYNKHYLQSEYIFATQSAQMAAKWHEFEQYDDRYYLQYRTAYDDRVRYDHSLLHNTTLPIDSKFWDKYLPPNGWRCRCTAVQVRKSKYEVSDESNAIEHGEKATHTIGAGGKNTSAMFRFNAGKQKIIFPETHPYYGNKEVVRKVKESAPEKGKKNKTDKSKAIIDLNEFIRGDEPTNKEISNILHRYAELQPDDFRRGLDKVRFVSSRNFMMQHGMSYSPFTKQWVSGSTITISTNSFSDFNPAKELREALAAIKRGEKLTFNQEYSIESLWHEILHGKTKTGVFNLTSSGTQSMETVNQFCARHTYDGFLERLGGKASHKKEILSNGLGYKRWVTDFRNDLKNNGISEKKAVDELMPKLLQNYQTIKQETDDFINRNKKKNS